MSSLQPLFDVTIPSGIPAGLNSEKVAALLQKLNSDAQFVLAQNVGTTHNLLDICLKRATVQGTQHVFQHAVHQEGKPVTNQKSSGEVFKLLARPWTFLRAYHCAVLPKNGLKGSRGLDGENLG